MNQGFLTMPSGDRISVEVAMTPEERAQGLMYRKSMPPNTGMLFVHPRPGHYSVWMKNTSIPLDIVWFDDKGKITEVYGGLPYSPRSIGGYKKSSFTLEIPGGCAREYRLREGEQLPNFQVQSPVLPLAAAVALVVIALVLR
jgi:uncharacterized protein